MRADRVILAAAAALAAPLAQAAQDPGLTLHETFGGARRLGVGAQAQLSIPLGGDRRDSAAPGPRLTLRGGPSLARDGANVPVRARATTAPLAELAFQPGYATTWSLAGRPVAVDWSARALREQRDRAPGESRSNLSTVAVVAIGVGVAVIVGGLLFIDAVNDASD